jgi:cytochrome c
MCIISARSWPSGAWRSAILVTGLVTAGAVAAAEGQSLFGFGEVATEQDIAAIDIDVMPDGRGAPPGAGSHAEGKEIYVARCASCHGVDLGGVAETGGAALVGGRGSLDSGAPKKTVESYWPYASTVFDFVKRAMPLNAPGSLADDEVYAVTAYILGEANIIDKSTVLDAQRIGEVRMPNRDGFIADPRPDVHNYR